MGVLLMNSSLYNEDLLKHHYHPSVVFYYFKQWNQYEMAFHSHPAVEIMYVISGECVVEFEENFVMMKKGQFILIDSCVIHRLIVVEQCRMLNIEFSFVEKAGAFPSIKELALENQFFTWFLNFKKAYIVLHDPSEVYQTLKSLVLELDESEKDNKLLIHLLISQLLIRIGTMAFEAEGSKKQMNISIQKAIEYIHHHYDCAIQVSDVAAIVHLHPGYLHRLFKAHMGCSIMEYVAIHRIQKAKALLLQTDMSITEVSSYIGMNSAQYFSTLFKKYTQMTPLEFRNRSEKSSVGYREG
jgi:AraC-like DNA-binding protein/mannose-6-phosphate isomerase-like protein (cupin superfamily)